MYTYVFIVILTATGCFCFAGYELFQGFNQSYVDDTSEDTADPFLNFASSTTTDTSTNSTFEPSNSTTTVSAVLLTTANSVLKCPEEERPANIGSYEIPTQRDLILFTKDILLDMFNDYNEKAFYLLKDIKEATKATATIERKCEGNKPEYRKCVKHVSDRCQQITKNLVMNLENRKLEITALTDENICKLEDMKTDPIQILQSIAQEKVSLEFALPGFLQLLSACYAYCIRSAASYNNKPLRHMTDQDLVIKHFLTNKNYLELITNSNHKFKANSN